MKVLDAFCGVGGATRGYQLAGARVTGVDIKPQPNYIGEEFHQQDAVDFIWDHGSEFDLIHASPPCQSFSTLSTGTNARWGRDYPDLIQATRAALQATGVPFVIENVTAAPIRRDLVLCGEMFGLRVIRHRVFETEGLVVEEIPHPKHRGRTIGRNHGRWNTGYYFPVYGTGGGKGSVEEWQGAMGIDWTRVRKELAEAIPPVYTEYIMKQAIMV